MTTTTPFERASTWTRDASAAPAARFHGTVEDAWAQGKGAFGGLLAAGLVRACEAVIAELHKDAPRLVRTLHVCFCGPARPGAIECSVVVERSGSLVTTLSARVTQGGHLTTLATATFSTPPARPVASARYHLARMPSVPASGDVEPIPADTPFMPAFTRFFEFRFALGDAPFSGAAGGELAGWIRLREPPAHADAALVAALVDASPPAMLPKLDEPRASASVNLTIDFVADPRVLDPRAPILHASRTRTGDGATTDETQDVWKEDGTLVATCRQLVVVL